MTDENSDMLPYVQSFLEEHPTVQLVNAVVPNSENWLKGLLLFIEVLNYIFWISLEADFPSKKEITLGWKNPYDP